QFASGLYVSNVTAGGTGEVDLVTSGNATPIISTGLTSPTGIAFNSNATLLYVADSATDTVNVYSNLGGSAHLLNTISLATDSSGHAISSDQPASLVVDTSGNVYVAMHDQTNQSDSVVEIKNAISHPNISVLVTQGI